MPGLQGFGLKGLRNFWELIPLVSILSFAGVGALGFSLYAVTTKSDVTVNKRHESPPWERVDFNKQQKILAFEQKYRKNAELEQLRKEIGSYKY